MRALMCILKDDSVFAVRFRLAPGPLFPNQRAWLPLAWIPACSRSLSAGHVNTCSLGPRCWAGRVWKHGFASFRTPSVSALGHPLCARPWGQSPEIVIVLTAKLRTCEPMSPPGEGHELLGPRGHVMAPERLGGQGGVGGGEGQAFLTSGCFFPAHLAGSVWPLPVLLRRRSLVGRTPRKWSRGSRGTAPLGCQGPASLHL